MTTILSPRSMRPFLLLELCFHSNLWLNVSDTLTRLVHPLSPRGKLAYLGLEGLNATNRLVDAVKHRSPNVVLRDRLYRLATSPEYAEQFRVTANEFPRFAEFLTHEQVTDILKAQSHGAMLLKNGCSVIHVPSYLQAIWDDCCSRQPICTWKIYGGNRHELQSNLSSFDAVVWCAGSGLFSNELLEGKGNDEGIQLVRGQSLVVDCHDHAEALLFGKYISPLPEANTILVGATHEFEARAWNRTKVRQDLSSRVKEFCPNLIREENITRVTSGYRVQTKRSKYGRLPIVGRHQGNEWIFTGLSSRGLLYHSLFGQVLAKAIVEDRDELIFEAYPELSWWRPAVNN